MHAARALPTGTVSFLFSDVEGSTRLLERYGDRLTDALTTHHELVATAVAKHDGVIFETVGDAVYAAFDDPLAAISAAVRAQHALHDHPWGDLGAIRIRAAVHRGPVELRGAHYLGPALFRAARIMALGHGGQTLASAETAEVVGHRLPSDIRLRSLGHHRLKDLVEGEDVHQVDGTGLPSTFPPLRSADGRLERLPRPISSFVPRVELLAAIRRAFEDGARLVTLTGAGGSGKTRVALEAARHEASWSRDGVMFVDLAAVRDPDAVLDAINAVIGVRTLGEESARDAFVRWLADRSLLLILDNLEQLLAAAPGLAEALTMAPGLRMLVTSRERLRIRGEVVVSVGPLPLTASAGEGMAPALILFADRAGLAPAAWSPEEVAAVRRICTRLDGLPLAIELAAARARSMPLAMLESQIGTWVTAGDGPRDLPERQRTLAATVRWSRDLLPAGARRLFDRLGVFLGPVPVAAAARLIDRSSDDPGVVEALARLVDCSLLQPPVPGPTGEPRFAMLQTTRDVAGMSLTGTSRDAAALRHASWMAEVAERAAQGMTGQDDDAWLRRVDLELPDLARAITWAQAASHPLIVHRIVGSIWRYAYNRSTAMPVIAEWARQALAQEGDVGPVVRARTTIALCASGMFILPAAELRPRVQEAIDLLEPLGPSADLAEAYQTMGAVLGNNGLERPEDPWHAAAARTFLAVGDERGVGLAMIGEAVILSNAGRPREAAEVARLALIHSRRGGSPIALMDDLGNAASIALQAGLVDEARVLVLELAELLRASTFRDQFSDASCLAGLGEVLMACGRPEAAAVALGCAWRTLDRIDVHAHVFEAPIAPLRARLDEELGGQVSASLIAEGAALDTNAALIRAADVLRGTPAPV